MGKWLKPNTLKELAKVSLTPMVRRKNQKRNRIVINNNTYELYEIRWLDIVGDSALGTAEEFDKMTCAEIISIAYIYKKTENFLYIFVLNESIFTSFFLHVELKKTLSLVDVSPSTVILLKES